MQAANFERTKVKTAQDLMLVHKPKTLVLSSKLPAWFLENTQTRIRKSKCP
jgi:hypothetical protein